MADTRPEPTPFLAHHGYTAESIEGILGPDPSRDRMFLLELVVTERLLTDAGYECRIRWKKREAPA